MTELIARANVQNVKAWRYDEHLHDAPLWVRNNCRFASDGTLLLVRSSGPQAVLEGEFLIKEFDQRELLWCTASMFQRDYVH